MVDQPAPSRLPGRDEMIGRIDALVDDGSGPAVLAIEVVGFDDLRARDERDARGIVGEVESRLDRLVRGRDVLGFVPPARFLIGFPSVTVETVGALVDRIRGAAAMPVEVAGDALSLVLDVGMAFWSVDETGRSLVETAESDLERARPDE